MDIGLKSLVLKYLWISSQNSTSEHHNKKIIIQIIVMIIIIIIIIIIMIIIKESYWLSDYWGVALKLSIGLKWIASFKRHTI